MKKSSTLWILALMITLASAYYQRRTGPSYPLRGTANLGEAQFQYRLERSHAGETNCPIQIRTIDPSISGQIVWKRHGVNEAWREISMTFAEGVLAAELPRQPPAGKLDYWVVLNSHGQSLRLPAGEPAVIRFRGEVPDFILYPHILAMFAAMLLSTRTGLGVFKPGGRLKALTFWTLGSLITGGIILGPIVQKYAFGAYWTGWPIGADLTDNKTFVALLAWILAAVALYRARRPEIWAAVSAAVLLAVYMIPHSVLGSELDYRQTGQHQSLGPAP
jgi:hypothetical protein